MTTTMDPTSRAVRAVMGWNGDDVTAVAARLGVSRQTMARRLERGMTSEQLHQVADLYKVDVVDLARGRVRFDTTGVTRW